MMYIFKHQTQRYYIFSVEDFDCYRFYPTMTDPFDVSKLNTTLLMAMTTACKIYPNSFSENLFLFQFKFTRDQNHQIFFFIIDAEGDIVGICQAKENENETRGKQLKKRQGGYIDRDDCRWWPLLCNFAGVIDITDRDNIAIP